ncbi:probable isoaspartyl peptidase/L-asparaginase CG7860 [Pseudomyrmex gracilis]|uniref:probable isoaspartyl peptidase/L-asparaginase CG7860 n=1 Tax=Pseudomyrmex gracilis TaxID=219809 RepID=UPI0009949E96|nr:probable isoaspartyl peptidase/L-asparaginase CG7860 [Pseudomyrmex gracilis]
MIQCKSFDSPCVLVHGGTGNFDDALIVEKLTSCKTAASVAYQSLLNGANSIGAVEAALRWLECDEFFNCGYGSLLNELGDVQMDATIVNGLKVECGSVAAVSDVEHPISLARYVLDNFPDSIVVGQGARKLAEHANLNCLSEGNMTAPAARLAYKLRKTDGSCCCTDSCTNNLEKLQCTDLIESKRCRLEVLLLFLAFISDLARETN